MSTTSPFTVYIKVIPHRGQREKSPNIPHTVVVSRRGSRIDHIRDLQKLGSMVYDDLIDNADMTSNDHLELAKSGGGQFRSHTSSNSKYGDMASGMAVTPQFGHTPAQLKIEGFFDANIDVSDADSISEQPAPDTMLIHSGDYVSGVMGQKPWLGSDGLPSDTINQEVLALKSVIENSISLIVDESGTALKIFRLKYKGMTWGDRGHHFPRP